MLTYIYSSLSLQKGEQTEDGYRKHVPYPIHSEALNSTYRTEIFKTGRQPAH